MKARLRALIIDDEPHSINSLKWESDALSDQLVIAGTSTNPREGLQLISELKPDIVFLDIEMPGMNGFELLQELDQIDFDIIFTTAYDEFAFKAFEIDATDYLLKPVSEEALRKAVDKVFERRKSSETPTHLAELFQKLSRELPDFKKVALPTLSGLLFIKTADITYCSSDSNYTHVHTINGERILISRPLKDIEALITDPRFLRVHHSYLVNLTFIREYHRGKGGSLVLEDGTQIPVSKHRKKDLINRF